MTYRVEVTDRASYDLDSIYRYIQAADSHHAATWFNGLYQALQSGTAIVERDATSRCNDS